MYIKYCKIQLYIYLHHLFFFFLLIINLIECLKLLVVLRTEQKQEFSAERARCLFCYTSYQSDAEKIVGNVSNKRNID